MMVRAFSVWGARASGVDISASSIEYARAHYPRCTFYCDDIAGFRRHGQTYDFVFSTEVMEHLAGPDEFMTTLRAITRPKAHVYIACPDLSHPAVPNDVISWSDICPPEHLRLSTRAAIEALFQRYGFRLKRAWRKRTPAHSLLFVLHEE